MTVRSQCAHCGHPMEMTIDSDLNLRIDNRECDPVIFVPDVDLMALDDSSIIDAF